MKSNIHRTILRKILNGLNKDPFLCISFIISLILFISITLHYTNEQIGRTVMFNYFMQTLQLFLLILSLYNLGAKK
jgi:hypothetical protein